MSLICVYVIFHSLYAFTHFPIYTQLDFIGSKPWLSFLSKQFIKMSNLDIITSFVWVYVCVTFFQPLFFRFRFQSYKNHILILPLSFYMVRCDITIIFSALVLLSSSIHLSFVRWWNERCQVNRWLWIESSNKLNFGSLVRFISITPPCFSTLSYSIKNIFWSEWKWEEMRWWGCFLLFVRFSNIKI